LKVLAVKHDAFADINGVFELIWKWKF
jgi:hypothetical protein